MALQRRRGHQPPDPCGHHRGSPKFLVSPKGCALKTQTPTTSPLVSGRAVQCWLGGHTVSLGSRPALSGGRQAEGNLCPSVFLSHGRWWRQLESWMPRGAAPPAPPIPASCHLCLRHHERFAAPESCEGPSTPTLLLQPPAPLIRTANLDGLLWIGAPVPSRPHPSHTELPQGTRSAWGTEGSPEQLHQSCGEQRPPSCLCQVHGGRLSKVRGELAKWTDHRVRPQGH